MTVDDMSQTQIDQIPTDFQAFLDKRSRRSGQRKRRGIKLFPGAGQLPSNDHILDFAHAYFDADPVAEAFVKDAYIDGTSSHGRTMLSSTESRPFPTRRRRWCACSRNSRRIPRGSTTIGWNAARSSSGGVARPFSAFSVWARCSRTPKTRSCSP